MDPTVQFVLVIAGLIALFVFGLVVMMARFYRKVNQGQALIVNKLKSTPMVTFTGATVYPIIHRAEVMDISLKTIELERRGAEGLICKDNIRADIKVAFFVRVNMTAGDVLKVAQAIGCERASDPQTMEELFIAKFSEALKTVGKRLDFVELYEKRDEFKDEIIKVIGQDLNGYVLEDAAIDFLEQTPLESLDKHNILDAEGIKKITQLTTQQNVLTNDFKQQERKAIKKQNVEAESTIFELERQRVDAEEKQKREIATLKSRESAEIDRVAAEERSRARLAEIQAEEEIGVSEENKARQIEVAMKNRERVVAVEAERVEKDRALEAISREREVELSRISKEKELEVQKKEIADVIRGRISVDKTVAQEEEAIKDLRALADANRSKDVVIISAEAVAQEQLVKDIKAAEASEEAAKFSIREQLAVADANLAVADKTAQGKIRLAEGRQAEVAADGLAQVRVKEADAAASEKVGLAKARVTLEEMQAIASGEEQQGLARVRIKEADAVAVQKQGLVQAEVLREKHLAEATGTQERGLAQVRVDEAAAAAIEKKGQAEALAVRELLVAEATGLAEKAAAMKALDGVGREHEEYRLNLEKDKEIALAGIGTRRDIAESQARIMRDAFAHAKIQIVGGDGEFFNRFIQAITLGQSIDGVVDQSDSVRTVFSDYLDGSANLPEDIKQVLSQPSFDASTLQQLSVTALLTKLTTGADPDLKKKLMSLVSQAKKLGLDETTSN